MKEVWRNVAGYEGLYEVSNWGRVKSLNYNHTGQEQILKAGKGSHGYYAVVLSKNRKIKTYTVHCLVAEAFIPNPDNLPIVNHKDENKENNFVFVREDGSLDFNKSNLEWCTQEYNLKYGTRTERAAKTKSKPVYQYTLSGEFVREWSSVREVERQTGWGEGNISACCNGNKNYSYAYGFRWSYKKL